MAGGQRGRAPAARIRPGWVVAAGLYSVLLLSTALLALRVWTFLEPRIGSRSLLLFASLGAVFLVAAARRSRRSPAGRAVRSLGLVVVFLAAVALMVWFFPDESPAKRFHLLQYGPLAYLVLEALVPRGWRRMVTVVAWIVAVAALDEAIQGLLPERFFAWRDILGNLLGAALGAAVWKLTSPGGAAAAE